MYVFEKYDYSMFESRFKDYNRLNNFPKGLRDLWDHLQGLAADTGEPMELDVIALCCEYSEDSIANVLREHDLETIEDLEQATTVIHVDDETVIYVAY